VYLILTVLGFVVVYIALSLFGFTIGGLAAEHVEIANTLGYLSIFIVLLIGYLWYRHYRK